MASYFIGDIQGCFDEFEQLLTLIDFCPQNDTLYLAGDLIGRGPRSLATLEFVVAHQDCIHTVLGNHDLHFLAIANGIKAAKKSDCFDVLLASPQLATFVDYLRQQPLLINFPQHKLVLTHAGITPQWDLDTAIDAANNVSKQLTSKDYCTLLTQMYIGNNDDWSAANSELSKTIFAINALTRMRYCFRDGQLDFTTNCAPQQCLEPTLSPWFTLPSRLPADYTVLFGHWASLIGITNAKQFIALDTGCLWGNYLTAWRLEDQEIFQIPAIH